MNTHEELLVDITNYREALNRLVKAVRLVAYHTKETASATTLTALYTHQVADNVKEYVRRNNDRFRRKDSNGKDFT